MKVRILKQQLLAAGYFRIPKRGKGSHSFWFHPYLKKAITLSGKDRADLKPYQYSLLRRLQRS